MTEPDDLQLNVASVSRASRVNGPGLRAVVWVQGCTIGCHGCESRDTWDPSGGGDIEPGAVVRWLDTLPPMDGPDEPSHYAYTQLVALRFSLPTGTTLSRYSPDVEALSDAVLVRTSANALPSARFYVERTDRGEAPIDRVAPQPTTSYSSATYGPATTSA